MSQMVTRIDGDTTLLWIGYDGFDPIQTQRTLNASGMALKEIRDDKWAVIESTLGNPVEQEASDG